MNENTLDCLELLFLALSDKTRLRLLALMAGGEVSVGYLADSLGVSQPKISRHLAYLRSAGLVSTRRDGKWIYYSVEPPAAAAARHVLFETLASLDLSERHSADRFVQMQSYSEQPFEPEYVPQEIDVFLL